MAVVESETSGNLRRLLRTLLKLKLNKQKPDKRSADDVAKKLHNVSPSIRCIHSGQFQGFRQRTF